MLALLLRFCASIQQAKDFQLLVRRDVNFSVRHDWHLIRVAVVVRPCAGVGVKSSAFIVFPASGLKATSVTLLFVGFTGHVRAHTIVFELPFEDTLVKKPPL